MTIFRKLDSILAILRHGIVHVAGIPFINRHGAERFGLKASTWDRGCRRGTVACRTQLRPDWNYATHRTANRRRARPCFRGLPRERRFAAQRGEVVMRTEARLVRCRIDGAVFAVGGKSRLDRCPTCGETRYYTFLKIPEPKGS